MLKMIYDEIDLHEAENFVNITDESNCVYQDYFLYSARFLELDTPQNWRDALAMYERLLVVA